jgi:hypothetical protein
MFHVFQVRTKSNLWHGKPLKLRGQDLEQAGQGFKIERREDINFFIWPK